VVDAEDGGGPLDWPVESGDVSVCETAGWGEGDRVERGWRGARGLGHTAAERGG
jgi:hypothetical protein